MKLSRVETAKTNTHRVYKDRGYLTVTVITWQAPGMRVVQVVAELQRELVLARGQLPVEHVLAVAEVDPRRRALDDVLAGRQTVLIDADVVVRHAGTRCR